MWLVPSVVTCTRWGAAMASSPLAPCVPRLFDLEHNIAVVNIASEITRRHPEGLWITERELRAGRITLLTRNREYLHRPDGVFQCGEGRGVAFELDRTPKSSARYERLLSDYLDTFARGDQLTGVVWVVESRTLATRIQAVISEQRAADVASVVLWSDGRFVW